MRLAINCGMLSVYQSMSCTSPATALSWRVNARHITVGTSVLKRRISKLAAEPHLILNRFGGNGREFQAVGMGFAADVTTEICDCGQTTPRVVNLPVSTDQLTLPRLTAGVHSRSLLASRRVVSERAPMLI